MNRKESTCPLSSDLTSDVTPTRRGTNATPIANSVYPFAVVLRMRVLQIVCGISTVVMGSVAFIEEKGEINLALGIPAGIATVIAAAAGIYTSRGFEGYEPPTSTTGSPFRFLGPTLRLAIPIGLLWVLALGLQVFLLVQCTRTLALGLAAISYTAAVLAGIEATLTGVTLGATVALLNIDCNNDPD